MDAKLILCLLLTGLSSSTAFAQLDTNRIRTLLSEAASTHNIPAISLAVVFDNQTYYFNHGTYERTRQQLVDENSIYQIASLGKPLIGIIYQQLIIDGIIDINQPITTYLPAIADSKRHKRLSQITIDHLLHHRSGLPQDVRSSYKRKDGEPYLYNYSKEDFYRDLNACRIRKPGAYQYSNFGFALLAFIATEVTNESFSTLLKDIIASPLGWKDTQLEISQRQRLRLTKPYRKDNRENQTKPWKMGLMAPPSAIYSSVSDFSQLLYKQIQAYQLFRKNQILTKWILTDNLAPKSTKSLSYGYGLNVYPGGYLGHSGDMDGYATDYSFNPEKGFGTVLMTSSGENWINPLIRKINQELESSHAQNR